MPRLSQSTPKYRKHWASGQAVVTLAGRDHYLSPWGTKGSRIEYDRLLGEWIAAGRPSHPSPAAIDITVVEVVAKYLVFARGYFVRAGKPTKTLATIMRALTVLTKRYGHHPAVDIGPLALKALQQRILESGSRESTDKQGKLKWLPISQTYVNNTIDRIRRVFR